MIGPEAPEPVKRVRADALERAEKAWNVRVMGGSWQQAAEIAGYADGSNALRAVRAVYGTLPTLERDEARRLWRDRLEVYYRQALKDLHNGVPGAITAAVRIAERAARLDGLDAPSRISLIDPTQEEIERFLTETLGPVRTDEEGDIFDGEIIDAEVIESE